MGDAAVADDTFGITEEEKSQKRQKLALRLKALFHRPELCVEIQESDLADDRAINAGLTTAENLVALLEKKKWQGLKRNFQKHFANSGITPNFHVECDLQDDEHLVIWLDENGIHCHKNESGVRAELNIVKMASFGLGRSIYEHLDDNLEDRKTKKLYKASYDRLPAKVKAEAPVDWHWARNYADAVSGCGWATTEELYSEMDGRMDVGTQMLDIIKKWLERR